MMLVYIPRLAPVVIFCCCVLLRFSDAIIMSAPDRCGGTHVVMHASACFGPKPASADVRDVKIFAPRPQANGAYLHFPKPSLVVPPLDIKQHPSGHVYLLSMLFGRSAEAARPSGMLVHAAPIATLPSRQSRDVKRRDSNPSFSSLSTHTSTSFTPTPLPAPQPFRIFSSIFPFLKSHPYHREDAHSFRQYHTPPHAEPPPHYALPVQPDELVERDDTQVDDDDEKFSTGLPSLAQRIIRSGVPISHLEYRDAVDVDFPPLFNACVPLSVPADMQAAQGRVVVVSRGVCDFSQKVTLMQNAGAVGVIVVDYEKDGENLVTMKRNDTKEEKEPIVIPSVMISYQSWSKIAPCSNDTTVVFTTEGENPYNLDQGRDALNWAMMRGMALWILCQCGVNVVRYKRRVSEFRARADAIAALPVDTYSRRQSMHESWQQAEETNVEAERNNEVVVGTPSSSSSGMISSGSKSPVEADPERLGLIGSDPNPSRSAPAGSSQASSSSPFFTQQFGSSSMRPSTPASRAIPIPGSSAPAIPAPGDDDDSDDDDAVCAICLEEFEEGQQVRHLACSHMYHRHCIDPWLQSSSNCCPLCKREVPNLPPPPTQLHYGSMIV